MTGKEAREREDDFLLNPTQSVKTICLEGVLAPVDLLNDRGRPPHTHPGYVVTNGILPCT